jgi:cold shock CspA family protein
MAAGEIKRLISETGIGFIAEVGKEEEISFQATALIGGTFDRLSEGQRVEFDHQPYSRSSTRTRAINVRVVSQT